MTAPPAPPAPAPETAWHARPVGEALRELNSDPGGLDDAEAGARLERHGPNALPEARRQGPLLRFALQFHNVLIYVLLAAALATALLGHWVDTWVILAVVLINAVIGFVQEGRAEQALQALSGMLSAEATAVRGGEPRTVPARELVPGDVVQLSSGDRVPADLRLLSVRSLRVEEAALTGESLPVEKSEAPVAANADLGDRASMAFSGTIVASGQARGLVVATGADTEIGRINAMVSQTSKLSTPLLRQVGRFGHGLTLVILGVSALMLPFAIFVRGLPFGEAFMAVVSLAVAAIPEGLPAIMTITLALGVQAMARQSAIIRRLPAVETLGAVSVICSDKTGTLTRNEMTVAAVLTAAGRHAVSGVGYAPTGKIEGPEDPALPALLRAGLLCNDARLREAAGEWRVEGDPTEGALLTLAGKAGLGRELRDAYPRLDAIPFESEHKFMATLHRHEGGELVLLKGAPEAVLGRCDTQLGPGGEEPLDRAHWERHIEEQAAAGQRLLALAQRRAPGETSLDFDGVSGGMTLLGLAGIIDPPREEAIAAVARCQRAGIAVKMITGDHALTAQAIAGQLGLPGGAAVTGARLEQTSDEELVALAREHHVFARTTPEHKLRLVRALQAQGAVVAMTGDGVNDAPALRAADVGVAMGIKGTEAAKEVSEMVLADDDFASIARAVEEGRKVYDNLKKTILFLLPTNGAQALVIVIALALGLTLPLTPLQLLWVNMVTAVTLGLALAFEPAEDNLMRRRPRDPNEPLLPPFFLWRIGFVSVLIMAGTLLMFFLVSRGGGSLETARTAAVGTLIFGQIFYLLNSRFMYTRSLRADILTGNRVVPLSILAVLALQGLFTYLPLMNAWFGTSPLAPLTWALAVAAGVAVFLAVELEKVIVRRMGRR